MKALCVIELNGCQHAVSQHETCFNTESLINVAEQFPIISLKCPGDSNRLLSARS